MRSLSLVMSECFLSGRGQDHVSSFYIVDLENLSTATGISSGTICSVMDYGLRFYLLSRCDYSDMTSVVVRYVLKETCMTNCFTLLLLTECFNQSINQPIFTVTPPPPFRVLKYTKFFLSRDAMLARYILCDCSVLVRLSVLLGAEGSRDNNSYSDLRRDVVGQSTRPIVTDA